MLVVGNVIGSAIFLTTGIMASYLPSPRLLIVAWLIGGVLALAGGLTCAELGAMFPRSGGWFVFLSEAYGPLWGFLFGWAGLLVFFSGAIAAVAVGFAEYFGYFFPSLSTTRTLISFAIPWGMQELTAGQIVAAGSILVLAAINYVGVKSGNIVQSALNAVKVLVLLALPGLALFRHVVSPDFGSDALQGQVTIASFGVAMIAVIWAFSGWDYVTFAAGEIRNPGQNIPRALLLGITTLGAIYLAVNMAYLYSVDMEAMPGTVRIAEKSVTMMIGAGGAALVAAAVMLSTFGCNAASIIPVSRVCYAMASDGLFFRSAARVHPRFRTPHIAILWTSGWSAFLCLTGTYEELYTYVTFTALIFNVAGGMAIFRLRHTQPDRPRPYRAWGYPWTPALFVVSTAALLLNTLVERPVQSIAGLGLLALGIPAYAYWSRKEGLERHS
jgi:APA family basic amino acid/polyamine antiporter